VNTNYGYVRRTVDRLHGAGIVAPCKSHDARGIFWELTQDGDVIGELLENAELLLDRAFHNNYKQ